jgi:putative nucleotidyltransferase with HDIG domain
MPNWYGTNVLNGSEQQRLLIVDDEPAILDFLCDLFADRYVLARADNGQQALAHLESGGVDIIVSDITMPGVGGIDLLDEICQLELDPLPDMILMTGNADVDSAIAAIKRGAYDYIRKPFDIDEILHAVDRLAQKRRLEHQAKRYRDRLESMVDERTKAYRQLLLATLQSLVRSLEFKDRYTKHHSDNVARYATLLAREAGFDEAVIRRVTTAGLLHDLGKIGIRDSVLTKPGRLTSEEFEHVKLHPVIGADILMPVLSDPAIIGAVRHHHEAWDGSGYPDGLRSDEIPLLARLLAIADSYDAMRAQRSYRGAMCHEDAIAQIIAGSGTRYDASLVPIFCHLDLAAIDPGLLLEPLLPVIPDLSLVTS